jgi:hypothetical protein
MNVIPGDPHLILLYPPRNMRESAGRGGLGCHAPALLPHAWWWARIGRSPRATRTRAEARPVYARSHRGTPELQPLMRHRACRFKTSSDRPRTALPVSWARGRSSALCCRLYRRSRTHKLTCRSCAA